MGKELLLEIGTEEIPAGFLNPTLQQLKSKIVEKLDALKITYDNVQVFGTPRRMVFVAMNVMEKQNSYEEEIIGPPKKIAFDDSGNFTQAALGFAKGQEIDVKQLRVISKEKKEYVCAVKKVAGKKTIDILTALLPEVVASLSFPKTMRWAEGDIRFVRPVHWILALFGGKTLKVGFGNIKASNKTYGHRFLANKAFMVKDFKSYKKVIEKGYVVLDGDKRRSTIINEARKIAAKVGGVIDEDHELFDTLANLVEYPIPLLGNFEDRFLKLPKGILINTMKKHQKYIPILNKSGKILPYFVIVSNMKVKNPKLIVNGNSKVIRARFSDADYYFERDKKIALDSRFEQLRNVVFHEKLGSYMEKTQRLEALSAFIAQDVDPALKNNIIRAAHLCKADLITGMVYEFPSLQGIIGGELSSLQGEQQNIANAIAEHYLPQSPDDPIPPSKTGALLALADKIDNLVGFIGAGMIPKGTSDPYGLRRQAIGIIRILLEENINLDLTRLIKCAYENLKDKTKLSPDSALKDVADFIENRFYYQMEMQGYSVDIIASVIATHPSNLLNAKRIIEVMNKEAKHDSFKQCVFTFKRITNITKGIAPEQFDPALFSEESEKQLFDAYTEACTAVEEIFINKTFDSIPIIFTKLKTPVDNYFEKVLIMDKNTQIKKNRLAFLSSMRGLFDQILDLTKIQL